MSTRIVAIPTRRAAAISRRGSSPTKTQWPLGTPKRSLAARNARVRAVLGTLLRPRVAFGLWATNLAIWHVPYLYDAALA